ncbi:hypothetical protein DAD186_08550 [Dermabacter vaginalis]|uniref:Uncharacterized protein n=1 Tax=Dermabacter vaginalis TaxID=1630135 RepID=A0A1B0ZHB9_9MICO|nr:hypothetical protein DAD186_08550 [Dermabacter vaginalis]
MKSQPAFLADVRITIPHCGTHHTGRADGCAGRFGLGGP